MVRYASAFRLASAQAHSSGVTLHPQSEENTATRIVHDCGAIATDESPRYDQPTEVSNGRPLDSSLMFGLFLAATASLLAQRGGRQSGSNLPTSVVSELVVHGTVVLPGRAAPERLVRIERLCGGRVEGSTYADSKGRFSFDLGAVDRGLRKLWPERGYHIDSTVLSPESMKDCSVRVSLMGYRSQTISIDQAARNNKTELGQVPLEPFGKSVSSLGSSTDEDVPKNARKDYEKGLDDAAKSKWQDAIGALQKATSAYPKFATAWLSSGDAAGFPEQSRRRTSVL